MTAIEAYKKVCDFHKSTPVVMACREYDKYFTFVLAQEGSDRRKAFVGSTITRVNKQNGEVDLIEYDEPYGYASKERWTPVDEEIFDTVKHSQRRVICINDRGQLVACDEVYSPFIEHHGVRGQQWGVRNGDYYPLLPSQHSSSEKRAGWRKSLEGGNARSSKMTFGDMYKAARKAGTSGGSSSSNSSESSSTSSSGGGAYAAMRDELIAKTKERLANSTATTDSGTKKSTKGSAGKASSGGRAGRSSGKSSDDASNDQNIIELKEELKKMREELEANTESLTSGSEEEEIDDGKDLNIDVEELVKESVDVDKYKETVENLLKDNEPEEVRKLIEKELLDDESGSYKELDDEVKEYLLDMVDKIIDENKSNKKSLTHYCINNRGYLVSYEEDYDLAFYHYGKLGMHWGIRRFQPYPKGYHGDGKFTGKKKERASADAKANEMLKSSAPKQLESNKGSKAIGDDAAKFVSENNIPNKHKDAKWSRMSEEATEASVIGLKALEKEGRMDPDEVEDPSWNDWFVWEDQTIGMYEVADLARQGKNVSEIKNIIKEASEKWKSLEEDDDAMARFYDVAGDTEALFDLDYYNYYYGDDFIENCVKEAQKRKGLQHAHKLVMNNHGELVYDDELYHHGILGMEHGKRNGPPYPLARGDHSAAERKAGWTKSLENIAKATGKGVARAARATGRGVKATGKGVASAAKATKKGLIRINLYPKKLMSDQDILDKVERLKKEDLLKHAKGKLTNEDKAAQKLKNRDAAREVVKQTLTQLLPSIGKDLVIAKVKGNFELQKKWDDKVREDIYEDARASGMSATDARKAADSGDASIAPRSKDNNKKGGKNQFDLENSVKQDIYNAAKKAGYTPTEAAKLAESGDDSALKGRSFSEGSSKKQTESSGSSGKSKGETKSEAPSAPAKTKQTSNSNDNQSDDKLDKDLVKKAQGAIYDEWIKSGASPAQAAKAASRMDDNVGTWKEAREKKAATEAANAKRRETVRKNKEAAEKAAQEAAFKKKIIDARQSYIDKRKEEAKDRVQEIGGTILGYRNGKVIYRDSKGNKREKDYVDAALRDFGSTLIADKPTAYNQITRKPTRLR